MAQSNNTHPLFSPAEKLTRADDLMSDVLDCFLWPTICNSSLPSKRTIKFTAGYRRPRTLDINDFRQIIHSVQTGRLRNLTEATTLIRQLPAVVSYMNSAEPPRLAKHIGLYLQLFLPKCGVRFCETDRYNQRRGNPQNSDQQRPSPLNPSCPRPKRQKSIIRPNELRDLLSSAHFPPTSSSSASSSSKLISTRSYQPYLSTNSLTHLAVFATKDYLPNDIVVGCEGSFADLTEQEDLKLRSNAHLPIYSNISSHIDRQSTDFSHIVNSRGKFQVFCGPARFVNHDCNNNVTLLREGFTIKFKVIKPIKAGEEILTSYGMNYFGEKNCECMCATCERNGIGFYSSQVKIPGGGSQIQMVAAGDILEIKKECEEPSPSFPSLGTDITDLSSLGDGGDETPSRASNTPASDLSPTRSFSHTPSQVRRQLALSSQCLLGALPETQSGVQSHSRSPSTRRNKPALPDSNQTSFNPAQFVSPVNFVSTHDLTLPVLSSVPEVQKSTQSNINDNFETSMPQKTLQLVDSKEKSELIEPFPVKKKTYWITTKQKQLGLVPWESESIITPPPTSISNQQSYSPQTPSLLNPIKRKARSEPQVNKKIKLNDEGWKEKKTEKAPVRSYWVSTKDKQLGIVPWETNKPVQSSPELTEAENTATLKSDSTARLTRASRKASQGTPDLSRFPTAPKGIKLSYKVFEEGTQEAEFLNTAGGRELLGFRPKLKKDPQKQQQLDNSSAQKGQHIKNGSDDANSNRQPPQVNEDHVDDTTIDTLEEISSFLMSHPEATAITTTNMENTNAGAYDTTARELHEGNQVDMARASSTSHSDRFFHHQTQLVENKERESGNVSRLSSFLTNRSGNNEQTTQTDDNELMKKGTKQKKEIAFEAIPRPIDDDRKDDSQAKKITQVGHRSDPCRIITTTTKAEGDCLYNPSVRPGQDAPCLSSSPMEPIRPPISITHHAHPNACSMSTSPELASIIPKLKNNHPAPGFRRSASPVHHHLSINLSGSYTGTGTGSNSQSTNASNSTDSNQWISIG